LKSHGINKSWAMGVIKAQRPPQTDLYGHATQNTSIRWPYVGPGYHLSVWLRAQQQPRDCLITKHATDLVW